MMFGAEAAHLAGRTPVIHLEGRLPVLEAPAVAALGLRDGQVVRPTVEVRDGQVRWWLQGQPLPLALPAALSLAAGDAPAFQVRVDAAGRATLQLLPEGQSPAAAAQAPAVAAGRLEQLALRPPGLGALQALLQPGALQALFDAAPQPQVAALVQQFTRGWPSTTQLTPQLLRQALRQGGWTQESALARGEAPLPAGPDAKTVLRLLLDAWTQAPASTRTLLRDALDDVEARQLQSLPDPQAGRELALAMLLPFADAEPVQVRWSREADADGRGGAGQGAAGAWVVDLHTRSDVFGAAWLRTRVLPGGRVELVMWAERADLAARARAGGPSLAAWLDEAGLYMTGLQVIHGEPPAASPAGANASSDPGRLVDLRA